MVFIGIIVVFGAVLGGFTLAGGQASILVQPAELIVICGAAFGTFLISSPGLMKKRVKHVLMVSLKDIIEPAKKDDLRRYLVTASIQKPDGNTFLPLLEVKAKPGEPFFVVGQTYKGGTVVIGIKVNP